MFNNIFFSEYLTHYEIMLEKCGTTRQATGDSIKEHRKDARTQTHTHNI